MSDDKQFESAAVENAAAGKAGLSQEELDELVASSDTGGRSPGPAVAKLLVVVALAWSLFQLWIASPLPFMIGWGVFNDTEARSIHLAFALFLAFAAYPAARTPAQLGLAIVVPVVLTLLFMYGAKEGVPVWWVPVIGLGMIAAVLLGSPKNWVPPWEWALAILG
ncbi:MAG: C4-dicarboxylate ABC transporter, partial [Pseudomonadota bacterium]|nr:C4-dicarboxylate ABC transporter [Pseudomonadota bacterium]